MGLFQQLDLSRLAKRLVSEDGLRDELFALVAIDEYKKFFFLLAECEECSSSIYLPSPIVDLVWQRHMLDTLNYFKDCSTFDMPNGYCHRHELRSPAEVVDEPTTETKEDSLIKSYAQEQYNFTVEAYKQMYQCVPPAEVWPAKYNQSSLLEKRTAGEDKYLSYAIPHASIPGDVQLHVDLNDFKLPDEIELTVKLMWVGELVFDTLPLKQLKCVKGEVIGLISFDAQREAAVSKVVREYARFLLLVMRQAKFELMAAQEGRVLEKTPEITPSKLVDELWHAHILCSPAYFDFCDKHAPAGRYLHHFPHFDKPHDYHVPGFSATLALYKEVYAADPADGVWGVLGESGGGGGGCGGGGGGGGGRSAPPPNFSILGAGAGCGIGPFFASCGAGNVANSAGFPSKHYVNLTENGSRKLICEFDILNAGLNKDNLADAPVPSYVFRFPYTDTYTKRYTFKAAVSKPVPFMTPQLVSPQLFDYWQTQVERVMEERYEAAKAISRIPIGDTRDIYNIEWKRLVHNAISALVSEFSFSAGRMGLRVACCFASGCRGGTIYIETTSFLFKYSPPPRYVPVQLPSSIAPNPPFAWNPTQLSPAAAHVFDMQWVFGGAQGAYMTVPEPPRRGIMGFPKALIASATVVPLCTIRTPFTQSYPGIVFFPEQVSISIGLSQYSAVSSYMETFVMKAASPAPVPFMTEEFVSVKLYEYLQYRIGALVSERQTVAKVLTYLPALDVKPTLFQHWTTTTESFLHRLLNELSTMLSPLGLRLRLGYSSNEDRFIVLQCVTQTWNPATARSRFSQGEMPPVDVTGMEHQMMLLVGSTTAAGAGRYQPPVFSSPATAPTAAPTASTAPPSVSLKQAGAPALAQAVPAQAPPEQQQNEVLSVTVPADFPQSGRELTIRSPTSGLLAKFTIPPGSLPGSQILISIPRK